jgi:hypothetical protein
MVMTIRPLPVLLLATALALSACGGTAGSISGSPLGSPSVAPSAAAATPIPIGTDLELECSTGAPCHCAPDSPCQFAEGTYATFGRWAFLPGLTMAIPGGWTSTEQDAGEFNLLHTSYPGGLYFWRDMVPVDPEGHLIAGIPSTPEALTDWMTSNPDLIVTEPAAVTIGHGVQATTFTFVTAPGARNMDPENCPPFPPGAAATCFAVFTDPAHWGTGSWWVASAHATRLYLASIGPAANPHLLVVAVQGTVEPPSTETDHFVELERIEAGVQPILDSLDVSRVTFN